MEHTEAHADQEPHPPAKPREAFRVAQCRSCRAGIIWAETQATETKPGRKIPIDADPDNHGYAKVVADGNIVFTGTTTGDGTPIVAYRPKNGGGRHVAHFVSCPNAKAHRKSR